MKGFYLLCSAALAGYSLALCPYSKRSIEDARAALDAPIQAQKEKRQSGTLPFTTFNTNQLVDVTGEHAWVAPGPNDIRGPCPGLNALANHGYFPHNGVVGLVEGWTATEQVYGMHQNSLSEA
jgi:hypothetical protein